MTSRFRPPLLSLALMVSVLGGTAVLGDARARYSLQVPDGLAFSEFEGYETWQVVSVSHPTGSAGMSDSETLDLIVANSAMVEAFAAGIPGNGKRFPDGAKAAKLQYVPKKSSEAPFDVAIPDRLKDVAFMVKDSRRFKDTGGWGYALFDYDDTSEQFAPSGTGAACGAGCHTIASAKDFVFTAFQKR